MSNPSMDGAPRHERDERQRPPPSAEGVDEFRELSAPSAGQSARQEASLAPASERAPEQDSRPALELETWRELVDIARHCPSPHNCQPWLIQPVDAGTAHLLIDGKRTFPWTDSTGSFVISAMNMFTAYLGAAAQNRGLALRKELADLGAIDMQAPRSRFATLSLSVSDNPEPSRYADADLMKRKTSRKENLPIPMPPEILAEVEQIVKKHGHTLVTTSDQAVIDKVIRRDIQALMHDINHKQYFGELKPYLKLGSKERTPDGLHYEAMNLPWLHMAALKYCPWAVKLPFVGKLVEGNYRGQLGHCERLGFISGDFWDRKDSLKAGDMLIESWLELSANNLHIHPFGNLVTNREARSDIEKLMGIEKLWFVFRVGYTDSPVKSQRRGVDNLIV